MELKGSKTERNLMAAFAGESQARNRYTYFSSQARKEGFRQIAEIFEGDHRFFPIWGDRQHGRESQGRCQR